MQITKAKNKLVGGLISAMFLSWGCITVPQGMSKNWVPLAKHRSSAPIDAFSLVLIEYTATPISCETADEEADCEEIMDELPTIIAYGSGSGVLIETELGPCVLSAAHVCENDFPTSFETDGVKIKIEAAMKITLHVPTRGSYSATVVRMDRDKDLCLLKPSEVFSHPVPMAETPPELGDEVYSISAPFGISGDKMALIFHGFYAGTDALNDDREVEFYTVPARPGSSGGPIFNDSWEVVGMIHTAFSNLEHVAIGTGLEDIRSFAYTPTEVTVESP